MMPIRARIYYCMSELLVAGIVSGILGFSLKTFCTITLLITLNVFSLPLFWVFKFPLWVYYVLCIFWIFNLLLVFNLKSYYEKRDKP